jgi:8-oxo-dGTP diphosphatase
MREETLCLPVDVSHILLGKKRQGFGKGKWNGFGGKINPAETIEHATVRELREECGLLAIEADLKRSGYFVFLFPWKPEWNRIVHVSVLHKWSGGMRMTEEMMPAWYKYENIPYDEMWSDDTIWLPLIMDGYFVTACFIFDTNCNVLSHAICTEARS